MKKVTIKSPATIILRYNGPDVSFIGYDDDDIDDQISKFMYNYANDEWNISCEEQELTLPAVEAAISELTKTPETP
jgi:hypothetical protein